MNALSFLGVTVAGFSSLSFLPDDIEEITNNKNAPTNKTHFPYTLIKKYAFPLIKIKVFTGGFKRSLQESPEDVLKFVEEKIRNYIVLFYNI